jgi:excinuclease UvrABC nuclease subunit
MINVNSSAVSEDILYEIALTKIPNIGPVLAKNLVAYCGSAKAIFETSANDLATKFMKSKIMMPSHKLKRSCPMYPKTT